MKANFNYIRHPEKNQPVKLLSAAKKYFYILKGAQQHEN